MNPDDGTAAAAMRPALRAAFLMRLPDRPRSDATRCIAAAFRPSSSDFASPAGRLRRRGLPVRGPGCHDTSGNVDCSCPPTDVV